MTDEELQDARRTLDRLQHWVALATIAPNEQDRHHLIHLLTAGTQDLAKALSYVDFLRSLLNDLQQDSAAYQRGIEAERERCAKVCEALARRYDADEGEDQPDLALGAWDCVEAIRGSTPCQRCDGTGIITRDDGWGTRDRCPDCQTQRSNRHDPGTRTRPVQ